MGQRLSYVRPTECWSTSCTVAAMKAPGIEHKVHCISLEERLLKDTSEEALPPPLLLFAHLFTSSAASDQAERNEHS